MEVDISSESSYSESDFDSDARIKVLNDHHLLQKVNKLEEYLPFTEEIRLNRQAILLNLKKNALKAVLEQGDSLNNWAFAFDHYLTAFGYAFTKDEHIIFVKICLQALDSITDNIPSSLNLLKLTTRLLAKTYLLSRQDLIIDWRLIYRLFERTVYSPHNTAKTLSLGYGFEICLRKLLNNARVYFPVEATAEILSEWRQYLCIYSSKFGKAGSVLANFLPTLIYPEEHQYGYQLWFQELMNLWIALPENSKNNQAHNCFVKLFSRLAKDAKGFIDWDPYLPVIFKRFKDLFSVDTYSYSYGNDEIIKLYIQWLVYSLSDTSKTLDYLQQFFRLRSVHFFISKEKSDSQFQKIVNAAVKTLTNRLRSERYKKNWFNFAHPASNLNNRLVNEFAAIMVTTVDKIGFKDFDLENLYSLCNISASILSGQVIEKLDLAYEQICEPKRLTTALQMFSMSLFPILTNDMTAAQYRLNVLPILTSLASNINTYDENLCFLQLFSMRSILVLGLPLVDCSHLAETLDSSANDAAKQLLLDTRQLDEFAYEFLRACFTIIESNNEDLLKMSKSRISLKMLLYESLLYVLANSSLATTKAILDKLFNYANSHIIENKKAAAVMGRLIQAAFAINAQYSMERFFSVVAENTLATIGNRTKIADICKTELEYNLNLLNDCYLVNDGKVLLAQEAKIVQVQEAIMKIQLEDNMKNWNLLGSLFTSLLEVRLLHEVIPSPKDDIQQLTNWPKTYAIKDMPLEWHVPKEVEIAFAKRLFTKFVEPEISRLDNWANSKMEMSKSQIEQSLSIVSNFASLKCFPSFSGGDDSPGSSYLENDICAINMFPGSTIREDLMTLMGRVLKRLLTTTDASSLLNLVCVTVNSLAISWRGSPFNFFLKISQSFDHRKLCHPLNNDTFFIPTVQFARMRAYHSKLTNSVKALREMKYTSGHKAAVEQLFILATCPYESVRNAAKWPLQKLLQIFPQSAELIVPAMLQNLQNSDQKSSFEGSLSVLIGSLVDSMLFLPSHSSTYQIWPTLLKANFEAVVNAKLAQMIDYDKFPVIAMLFNTIPIKRNLMNDDFSALFEKAKLLNFSLLSSEEMKAIELGINQWNEKNQNQYNDLIQQLCVTLKEHKLQFRMQTLGTFLLNLLIRHDQLPPENMILYFLDALIHDSIHVRRTAVMGLKKILFLNRAPTEKVQVQYKATDFQVDVYSSKEVYCATQFHDKAHAGYFEGEYTAKKMTQVPVATNSFIAEKFKDKQYIDSLFELFSVENATAIDNEFLKIWKYLYQCFGLFNDELVFPHIEKLLEVDKHSHDKLAIEVMIGLANALPVLNYVDALKVVQFLSAISKKHLLKFNSESSNLWSIFVIKIFNDRDIRRNKFLLNQLLYSTFHDSTISPFYQSSFLQFLTSGCSYNFKYPEINQAVLSKLEENLSHPYQNVRIAIAQLLSILFPDKVGENSRLVFVQRIVSKFEKAMLPLFSDHESGSNMTVIKSEIFNQDSVEGKELLNFIETVSTWITYSLDSSKLINPADFILLFPYLCSVQLAQSNNSQVQNKVKRAIELIGKISYSEAEIDGILQMVEKVANNWNWRCRNQVPFFLQHFLYTNIFVLSRIDRSRDRLVKVLNKLMEDEVVEVRESASITLSSLLIWNAVHGSNLTQLVEQFKSNSVREAVNGDNLLEKHSGVLGLCAFLYACPDDLPVHLPDILLFLTNHMSAPQPIPKSITKAFNSFKRFHLPNWVVYKRQFTSDQLNELNNIFISPSYYA